MLKNMDEKMGAMANDVKDNLTKVSKSMDVMNENMGGMKSAIHQQTLSVLLKEVLSDDSTKYVSMTSFNPLPMIPAAKGLADAATTEELASLFYLWITEINTATVDDGDPKAIDLFKMKKLCALQAIGGMLPDEKINGLTLDDRYRDGVTALLLLRRVFITSYVLDNGLLTHPLDNQSTYDAAKAAIMSIKQIEEMPEALKLELKIVGFNFPEANQTVKIEEKTWEKYLVQIGNRP